MSTVWQPIFRNNEMHCKHDNVQSPFGIRGRSGGRPPEAAKMGKSAVFLGHRAISALSDDDLVLSNGDLLNSGGILLNSDGVLLNSNGDLLNSDDVRVDSGSALVNSDTVALDLDGVRLNLGCVRLDSRGGSEGGRMNIENRYCVDLEP